MEVRPASTILQACELAGARDPRFCYHERLSIAGNCRMCLVEVSQAAQAAGELRAARRRQAGDLTTRPMEQKARKRRDGIPADQPSAGLPDLRQAASATCRTRRWPTVRPQPLSTRTSAPCPTGAGPLVKTSMNRCIHCTRCIRFATEWRGRRSWARRPRRVDGSHDLVEHALTSELSGNLVDLCPVGALTSNPTPSRRVVGAHQDRVGRRQWTRSAPTSASTRAARRSCACCAPNDDVKRGVDLRQDSGTPSTACAISASIAPMCAKAASSSRRLGPGVHRHRREARQLGGRQDRGHPPATSGDAESMVALKT